MKHREAMRRLAILAILLGCDDPNSAPAGDAAIDHDAARDAAPSIDAGPDALLPPSRWTDAVVLESSGDDAVGLVVDFRGGHGIAAWTMVACTPGCDGARVPWFAESHDGVWSAGTAIPSLAGTRVVAATADDAGHFILYTVRSGQFELLEASRYVDGAWRAPVLLQADDLGGVRSVRVSGHRFGDQVVVWEQASGDTVDVWANVYSYLDGWTQPRLLETAAAPATGPVVALDDTGVALVAWLQDGMIVATRLTPSSGWLLPETIGTGTAGPEVAWGGDGAGTAIWRDGSALREVRFHGPGRAPTAIDGDVGITSAHLALAADETGQVAALWLAGATDARSLFQASYVPGSGWGSPTAIDALGGAAADPATVFGPGDEALATWTQPSAAIVPRAAWSSRRTGAAWSEPVRVAEGLVTCIIPFHDPSIDQFGAVWLGSTGERTSVYRARLEAP